MPAPRHRRPRDGAAGLLRIGLVHYNTGEEVDATLAALDRALT